MPTNMIRVGVVALALAWMGMPALAQQPIKIGFVNVMSGPNTAIGNDLRDGFELGLDHLGRKMAGRSVEVVYADDRMSPEIGKQVTEKLIQESKVDFLSGYNWSNVLIPALKTAHDSQVFLIGANAGPSQIAGELCSPWFFGVARQNDQPPVALGEMLNKRGVKRLYIMAPNYAAGKDMAAGVKRLFKGEIVGEEYTRWPDQLDFAVEMARIRATAPDAVWAFYPGAAAVQFFLQYSQTGLKGKIPLYTSFTAEGLSLPLIKEMAEGSFSAQNWVVDMPNPVNQRFVADFRKKYNRIPSFYAPQAYDAAMLINAAVEAVKGDLTQKDAMRAAMRQAKFPNTRGETFRFGKNHFPIQDVFLEQVVKDAEGNFTLKTVELALKAYQDIYSEKCAMSW